MKKINLLLMLAVVVTAFFSSCKKKEENKTTSEQLLTGQTWSANVEAGGVFVNGSKVFGVPLTLNFTANALSSATLPTGTMKANGQTIPATWYMNAEGTQLTVAYPNGTGVPSISGDGTTGIGNTTLTTTLTAQQFVIKNTTTEAIQVFGVVSIPANGELRFSVDGVTPTAPETNAELTAKTWVGEGLYTIFDANGNTITETKNDTDVSSWKIKFNDNFGINTISFSGIPAPATWAVSGNKLTLNYLNTSGESKSTEVTYSISENQLIMDFPLENENLVLDMGLLQVKPGLRLKMNAE